MFVDPTSNGGHNLEPILTLDYVRALMHKDLVGEPLMPIGVRIGRRQWDRLRSEVAVITDLNDEASLDFLRVIGLPIYLANVDDYIEFLYADSDESTD